MNRDIIYLRDLRIETTIGIFAWERCIKQTVSIDLDLATDIRRAANSDAIGDALDYKAVAKRMIDFVGNSEFRLVETLAEKAAQMILDEFRVPWLRISINKTGAIRGARDVGVVIERDRS